MSKDNSYSDNGLTSDEDSDDDSLYLDSEMLDPNKELLKIFDYLEKNPKNIDAKLEEIEFFLKNGASAEQEYKAGETLHEFALRIESDDLLELLNKYFPEESAEQSISEISSLQNESQFDRDIQAENNLRKSLENNDLALISKTVDSNPNKDLAHKIIYDYLKDVADYKILDITKEKLEVLKKLGADVYKKNEDDKSIFDYAVENQRRSFLVIIDKVFPRDKNKIKIDEVKQKLKEESEKSRIHLGSSEFANSSNYSSPPVQSSSANGRGYSRR